MKNQNIILSVSVKKEDSILSKEQKKFNKLTKDIEKERDTLTKWNNAIPRYQKTYIETLCPLLEEMEKLQADMVRLMDDAYTTKRISKKDKEKINYIVCELLDNLMDANDSYKLKDIYKRHLQSNFEQDLEKEKQDLKNMISANLGIDLGDDVSFDSPEEFMASMASRMQEKMVHESEQKAKKTPRKKSARTLAREQKIADEAAEISESIKEVHRKLALRLHPDTEQDPIERERKTNLMQRVNIAYKNKNLLQLLELQLEAEMVNKDSLSQLSYEKIKVYNKILRDQLNSIRQEINSIQMGFRMSFDYPPGARIGHASILTDLKHRIKNTEKNIEQITEDLIAFQELKALKSWLKDCQIPTSISIGDLMLSF